MQTLPDADKQGLAGVAGSPEAFSTDASTLEKLSKDFYWYSPVLEQELHGRTAQAVIHITSEAQLKEVVAYCVANRLPMVPRGAATGNYGQVVPMAGGVILNLATFDGTCEVDAAAGTVRVSPGVRCQVIEEAARPQGWEMPMYPSTWVKATIGGFLAGGSAGIGSIRHGMIRDGGFVRSLRVLTAEQSPRIIQAEGPETLAYLHGYGINGIITDIVLNLTPKASWDQIAFSGTDFENVFGFAVEQAHDEDRPFRMLNFQQWPIPSFFKPIRRHLAEGEHLVQVDVLSEAVEALRARAFAAGLTERIHFPHAEPRRAPMLSDFVQNHSTLWAKKADAAFTYTTARLDLENWREPLRALNARYPETFFLRADFNRADGQPNVAAGPIYRAHSAAEVVERQNQLKEFGLFLYDVHCSRVDREGARPEVVERMRALKAVHDPFNLLNPGRLSG